MEDTPTTATVRKFLALVSEGPVPTDEELARTLDELALAYWLTPDGDVSEEEFDPPPFDHQESYKQLSQRFPEFGMYAVSDPTEAVNDEQMCGDAIDDLSDIRGDLMEVLWRYENVGPDEAHWYFKLLYWMHWGRHLRELSLYLHAKMWG
jgi:hypothetical protein